MSNKYNYGVSPFISSKYVYNDKERNIDDYVRYMFIRSTAMFQYHNLPETITKENLEMMLQTIGYVAIAEVDGELYALQGGLGGVPNAYNEPTEIVVSNPYLKFNKTLTIDKDCVVMLNDTLKMGLLPMFGRYCTMLVENDITMVLATVNKRIQTLLSANDDNTAESARQFLKQVFDGKLGIITETKLFDSLKSQNGGDNNVVTMQELCEYQQYIKASMFNEIGINLNSNMKKERLISNEVEMNSEHLYPLVDTMLECRRTALEKVNEMFGTDIQVEFNSSWDYRLLNGEPLETMQTKTDMGADETIIGANEGENLNHDETPETGGTMEEQSISNEEQETNVEPLDEQETDGTEDTTDGTEDTTDGTEDTGSKADTDVEDTEEKPTEDETDGTEDTEETDDKDEKKDD